MNFQHIYHLPQFGQDWFTFPKLYSYFVNNVPNGGHIVEVGSWKGKSAAYMAVEIINSKKNIRLDCIDQWDRFDPTHYSDDQYAKNNSVYELFLSNIEPVKHVIHPIKKESIEASKLYGDKTIDVVFIDACHDYDCVICDINAWLPKIKTGGIIGGHDYNQAGVKMAVKDILSNLDILEQELCWYCNIK
jgi:predicted O-methyltransferase YrrM